MEKRTKYGTTLLLFLITGLSLYGYIRHSSGSTPIIAKADLYITADDLIRAFERNESFSDSLYLYKKLSVRGIIKKVEKNESGNYMIFLGTRSAIPGLINCYLDSLYRSYPRSLHIGDSCILIGTCAGHLSDVILVGCIIEK